MELILTRVDGALSVSPAPPYLIEYLQYHHRSFATVNYRRENKFELRLLHTIQQDGSLVTFPGFYDKIMELCKKHNDTVIVVDSRTPLPPVDWQAIGNINWRAIGSTGFRDYQLDPIAEFLTKAQNTSGIINASGGFGLDEAYLMN